jgi:hypothetical protein
MGFQWVKDPSKYHDLPTPIEWYDDMTVFTTSMTHQLHCLVRYSLLNEATQITY